MKKIPVNYVSLFYNSSIGYSLLMQEIGLVDNRVRQSINVTFFNSEDCYEYLEAKAGKVVARGFKVAFEEINKMIVGEPDIRRGIASKCYVLKGGMMEIK